MKEGNRFMDFLVAMIGLGMIAYGMIEGVKDGGWLLPAVFIVSGSIVAYKSKAL